ncbi:hypothetical protein [Paenibacillus contaminans]|nr:hypothetical protein [Paenibacillus contaminans]
MNAMTEYTKSIMQVTTSIAEISHEIKESADMVHAQAAATEKDYGKHGGIDRAASAFAGYGQGEGRRSTNRRINTRHGKPASD